MEVGRSKNKAKTGSRMVPKPNPEKKVRKEASKETNAITIYIALQ